MIRIAIILLALTTAALAQTSWCSGSSCRDPGPKPAEPSRIQQICRGEIATTMREYERIRAAGLCR